MTSNFLQTGADWKALVTELDTQGFPLYWRVRVVDADAPQGVMLVCTRSSADVTTNAIGRTDFEVAYRVPDKCVREGDAVAYILQLFVANMLHEAMHFLKLRGAQWRDPHEYDR